MSYYPCIMVNFPVLGILFVSILSACSAGPQREPDFISVDTSGRFIQAEPAEIIHDEVYSEDQTTQRWGVHDWHPVGSTVLSDQGGSGLSFGGPKGSWAIQTDVGLEASTITWLLLEFAGRPLGHLVLQWSGSGESFTDEQSLVLGRADGIAFKSAIYRFPVSSHPLWKGRIAAIRLRCPGLPGQPMTLLGVSGGIRALRPGSARILEPVWKVELGRDLRNGFVALPGGTRTLQADGSIYDRFVISVGLESTAIEPVTFSVLVDTGSGPPQIAVERTLDPELGEGDQWFDLEIDLDRHKEKVLTFSLTSNVRDLTQLGTGLAWWAGPRMAGPVADSDHPNIVVFCVDTLRADRMSVYGNPTPTTPELEKWVQRSGVVFETVIASAPWTLPSHVSMFSGVAALRHGVNHAVSGTPGLAAWERPQTMPMIAEVLREYGYHTAAFTGGAYLHPRWGFARGFDRYTYWSDRGRSRDELVTNLSRFRDWAVKQRQPWFAFVHTYEVHDPYSPRTKFFERLSGGISAPKGHVALQPIDGGPEAGFRSSNRWVLRVGKGDPRPLIGDEIDSLLPALYDSHVAYVDEKIGSLLNRWSALGLAPDTIVAVTSDHGQVFGETSDAGHTALNESTITVPLLLALPDGLGAGQRISGQARLIDLFPTLLDGAGLAVPASVDGVSLMPSLSGQRPIPARSVSSVSATANVGVSLRSSEGLKVVFNDTAWRGAEPRLAAFDIVRDPKESTPLAAGHPGVSDLVRELSEMIQVEAPGLVLTATAGETADLVFDLSGAVIQKRGIRTLPQHPVDLLWRGIRHATLRVPGGERVELRFEKIAGETLTIRGGAAGSLSNFASEHEISIVSVRDLGPVFLSLEQGLLFERAPDARTSTTPGVFLTWRGPRTSGLSTDVLEGELSEQLRALGYLE